MTPAAMLVTFVLGLQATGESAASILDRYVNALGGADALRGVRTRITEGRFDNGRGLNERFRIYEQAPDKRAIVIGSRAIESPEGSGRAYDGAAGWDKNFIGTGLRTVTGQELVDLARDADIVRALRLGRDCSTLVRENSDGSDEVVRCQFDGGRTVRFFFDRSTGLLIRQEATLSTGVVTTHFDDYRLVDGVRTPFRTRILLPVATVSYSTEQVRQNVAIDERVFHRPER